MSEFSTSVHFGHKGLFDALYGRTPCTSPTCSFSDLQLRDPQAAGPA